MKVFMMKLVFSFYACIGILIARMSSSVLREAKSNTIYQSYQTFTSKNVSRNLQAKNKRSDLITKKIRIVSYNDVYVIDQVRNRGLGIGGASRFSQLVHKIKKEDPNTLVLFSGDTISPSLWSTVFKGQQMIEAHNQIGVDYACLGNHEFDFGLKGFYRTARTSAFGWLNSNCYDSETKTLLPHTIPHVIREVNGVPVGIFGVMYDMNDPSTGAYFTNPIIAAREQVAILKEKGAEFIIALTHQFWEDDNEFATNVEGVNLILGGHDHKAMIQTEFGTTYVKSDMDFKSLWETNVMIYNHKANKEIIMEHQLHRIREDMPTDPVMEKMIIKYRAAVNGKFKEVIGSSCSELDLKEATVRRKACPIGNFIADAMHYAYGLSLDVAFMNGGGIRSDQVVPEGNITAGHILSWCPFGNTVYGVQMSGNTFRDFLNSIVRVSCGIDGNVLLSNGYLPHPSGFEYTFKCTNRKEGEITRLVWKNQTEITATTSLTVGFPNFMYIGFKGFFDDRKAKIIVGDANSITIDMAIHKHLKNVKEMCPTTSNRFDIQYSYTTSTRDDNIQGEE